jgi:hypothetical protein
VGDVGQQRDRRGREGSSGVNGRRDAARRRVSEGAGKLTGLACWALLDGSSFRGAVAFAERMRPIDGDWQMPGPYKILVDENVGPVQPRTKGVFKIILSKITLECTSTRDERCSVQQCWNEMCLGLLVTSNGFSAIVSTCSDRTFWIAARKGLLVRSERWRRPVMLLSLAASTPSN